MSKFLDAVVRRLLAHYPYDFLPVAFLYAEGSEWIIRGSRADLSAEGHLFEVVHLEEWDGPRRRDVWIRRDA